MTRDTYDVTQPIMTHMVRMNRRGVTLIEVLMVIVISAIAMFALVPPFLAEGSLFRKGKRQTEAQRDAQMALRSMARFGRESTGYSLPPAPTSVTVRFTPPVGGDNCFIGTPISQGGNGQFVFNPGCGDGQLILLIDGVRSRLEEMTATAIVPNKLLRVRLVVSHRLRGNPNPDPRQEDEVLDTTL